MNKWLIRLIKYGCCALFVGLWAWGYLAGHPLANEKLYDQYRILCDAFTVPGSLLLMIGCLVWASGHGALDGLGYVLSFATTSLIPGKRKDVERFYDYVQRKREKRTKGYGFLLISGLVTLAIAMVFFALFYSVYPG